MSMGHENLTTEARHAGAAADSIAGTFAAVIMPRCCICRTVNIGDNPCRCTQTCDNCGIETWAEEIIEDVRGWRRICLECRDAGC